MMFKKKVKYPRKTRSEHTWELGKDAGVVEIREKVLRNRYFLGED